MSDHNTFDYVPWLTCLLKNVGFTISTDSMLLDFGCGQAACVDQFRQAGYQVYGGDIVFPDNPNGHLNSFLKKGIVRKIKSEPYRIPFDDNMFDVIFSLQVFEHVMDYPTVLQEFTRTLKPGGLSVNVFPGRYTFRESHVYVPLASIIQNYWWLLIWAILGIRNEFEEGMSARETASINFRYLRNQTNYLTRRQIRKFCCEAGLDCKFAEDAYLFINTITGCYTIPSRIERLMKLIPFYLNLYKVYYSDFKMRVMVLKKIK